MTYQQQMLAGMNPVELIVALYDGMAHFLYRAIAAIEQHDPRARRVAVGRVLQILMHLQSRLRTDVGGNSAKALSEFYASIFALCLEGSRLDSAARLKEAIGCIRDVREAWSVASRDPEVVRLVGENHASLPQAVPPGAARAEATRSHWTA